HAVAVIGEEFGELNKAVLQAVYEPNKSTPADVREEAIQTAAMALRFLHSLDRYVYQPGPHHAQTDDQLLFQPEARKGPAMTKTDNTERPAITIPNIGAPFQGGFY